MKSRTRLSFLLSFAALVGCGESIATVSIALSPPERVTTTSIFVWDENEARMVATTTVPADRTLVPLGVPAERPLIFNVVSRLQDGTPAFAGRARRVVPLGSERVRVPVTARPAGVLDFRVDVTEDVLSSSPIEVSLEGREDQIPTKFSVPRRPGFWQTSFVLEVGAYEAVYDSPDGERLRLLGARQMVTTAEQTTIGWGQLIGRGSTEGARRIAIELDRPSDEPGDDEESWPTGEADDVRFRLTVLDENDLPIEEITTRIMWSLRAWPAGELDGFEMESPADVANVDVVGARRFRLTSWLEDAPDVRGERLVNVIDTSTRTGEPVEMELSLDEMSPIELGVPMTVAFTDADGHYARGFTGVVDFSASDPTVATGASTDEPTATVAVEDGARVLRYLYASSGADGAARVLRVTATSTRSGTFSAERPLSPVRSSLEPF